MNDKLWARTNRIVQDKSRNCEIAEGTWIRILPWMTQKDYRNVKIEYIDDGGVYELFVREDNVDKLTKDEVRLMDLLYKGW